MRNLKSLYRLRIIKCKIFTFFLFITEEIFQMIVDETNAYTVENYKIIKL